MVHIPSLALLKDLLAMECSMLTTLNFQIAVPTASHFFALLEKVNNCDDVHLGNGIQVYMQP